jgi:hypothetical protein
MTPNECPQSVLAKLFALQSHVERCGREANSAEHARDIQRATLSNRHPASMREHKSGAFNLAEEQRKLDALTQQAIGFRQIATTEAGILERVKAWLDALPNGTALETVAIKLADGDNIATVRTRLADIAAELKRLQAIPIPDPDLKRKVEEFVRRLAARAEPALRGIEQGAPLRALWPADVNANPRNLSGYDEFTGSALLMFAWLMPSLLADRLLAVANGLADELVPAAERPDRIAALNDEILPLRHLEEALICKMLAAGEAAVRDPQAPPEAVLQVRLRAKVTKSSPATTTRSSESEMASAAAG